MIFCNNQNDPVNVALCLTSAAMRASVRAVWVRPVYGFSEHLCASLPRAREASCAPRRPSLPHFARQSWRHPAGPQWRSRRSLRGGMKDIITRGEHVSIGSVALVHRTVTTQAIMTHLPYQHWAFSESLPAPSPPLIVWPPTWKSNTWLLPQKHTVCLILTLCTSAYIQLTV